MTWIYKRVASEFTLSNRVVFYTRLYLPFLTALFYGLPVYGNASSSSQAEFEAGFIHGVADKDLLDISFMLEGENKVMPGKYLLDISVNGEIRDKSEVLFHQEPNSNHIVPCLSRDDYLRLGVTDNALTVTPPLDSSCLNITLVIKGAKVDFDSQKLMLNITVPQAYMQQGLRGYVDPKLWDRGINAGFINYQFSSRKTFNNHAPDNQSTYLGLQNGINLGSWRLRNESNITKQEGSGAIFTSNRSFIHRDIQWLNSQMYAGDVFSDATLFDSVKIRGIQLKTDESMLPDSERGYAPVIRGTASSSATVEVRQDSFLIYSINVPPGPFVITNLFPSGSNGDLEITIIEADGRRHQSIQAFSTLPIMARRGNVRYSLAAGRYRPGSGLEREFNLATSSWIYGISDNLTLAGGIQLSQGFSAANIGVGANTRLGAVSADITQSRSQAEQMDDRGQSLRLLYSKTLGTTFTNFTLTAYRYSTEGYRTFNDHALKYSPSQGDRNSTRSKSRMDLNINQKLGTNTNNYGTLYLAGSLINYWGNQGKAQSLTAGYGNSLGRLNYDITLSRSHNVSSSQSKNSETQLMLMLSLPLGQSEYAPYLNYYGNRSSQHGSSNTLGMNGYLSGNRHLSYSLQMGRDSRGHNNGSGSLNYSSPIGTFNSGYSQGQNYRAASLGASGAVVLHQGGINIGQQVGETFGLVEIEGIPDVPISGGNIKTGWNGYAVVPYLQPYRRNSIGINADQDLNADIDIEQGIKQVVPSRGAITKTALASSQGRRVLFQLFDPHNRPMPFGAQIFDEKNQLMGISDPSGQSLLLLEQESGLLTIKWDKQSCIAPYQLAQRAKGIYFDSQALVCMK